MAKPEETDRLGRKVMLKYYRKGGRITKVVTGMGIAPMQMWALNNANLRQSVMIIDRETGIVECIFVGRREKCPQMKEENLGICTDYGISMEFLQSVEDSMFDKEG